MGSKFSVLSSRDRMLWTVVAFLVVVLLSLLVIGVFFPSRMALDVLVGVEVGYDDVDDFIRFFVDVFHSIF